MDLYIKSNPNYANKVEVSQISEKDVHNRIVSALNLLGQLRTIHSLMSAESDFIESVDAQQAAMASLMHAFDHMVNHTKHGINSFKDHTPINDFAHLFAHLASGSDELHQGIVFKDLRSFIQNALVDSRINQRIANKELAAQKEKQEEAERQKQAEAKANAAEVQHEHHDHAAHHEHKHDHKEHAHDEKEETKGHVHFADNLVQEHHFTADQAHEEETKGNQRSRGSRGGHRGNHNGDHHHEEHGDSNFRARGERRGGRGHRGRPKSANEDDEGFVTETGRTQHQHRGGRRGHRGDRGGDRGGDR